MSNAFALYSRLLEPAKLSSVPASVFSLLVDLPDDVQVEIENCADSGGVPNALGNFWYAGRECFVPTEGPFPILVAELLYAAAPEPNDRQRLAADIRAELSQLTASGRIGNMIMPERIYAFVKRILDVEHSTEPLDRIVFKAARYLRSDSVQSAT